MLKIFVDESGNLGTQGRYFAIGALITEDGKRIRNILKRHCAARGLDEYKNREATFPEQQDIAQKIKKVDDHQIGYVCVDKTMIQSERLRADKNLLFNYTFTYLMKEIVAADPGQDLSLLIDNRNQKVGSTNSLGDYLRIKAYADWGFEHGITTRYCDSKDSKLVQVADFVSGTVLEKYKRERNHVYDILQPDISVKFPNAQFGR